mmetsp:Transcript_3061/g.6790  ORF Transcript_3061/g.6790 Transcript_3061/m.6790 type:complete len:92 (+) Transcript_3061:93-368(+)
MLLYSYVGWREREREMMMMMTISKIRKNVSFGSLWRDVCVYFGSHIAIYWFFLQNGVQLCMVREEISELCASGVCVSDGKFDAIFFPTGER